MLWGRAGEEFEKSLCRRQKVTLRGNVTVKIEIKCCQSLKTPRLLSLPSQQGVHRPLLFSLLTLGVSTGQR